MPSAVKTQPVPSLSPLAGQPAPEEMLVDVARLERDYFERQPNVDDPNQMVSFGTSGHRGSPLRGTSTEAHILAITQAICDYRRHCGTDGPLFMGKDTQAVSDPAQRTALEVLAANNVDTVIQHHNGITPTPVISHTILFGGEESAGANSLRRDGTVWATDKDGVIMSLLAAEITATTGKDPGEHYRELTAEFGTPYCTRIDSPTTPEQKARLLQLSNEAVEESSLAGEPILAKLTRALGNNTPVGGLKIVAASGWFAARPSGTEDIYKIYAESFKDQSHLNAILAEAEEIVNIALDSSKGRA